MDATERINTVSRDERGVIVAPNALLTDPSGDMRVGTGSDWFPEVFDRGVFVDKSLLIRDVIMGSQAVLFCRPRRFGKTLGATMLKDFFECAPLADPLARSRFERLTIWEVDGGRWRAHQGRHPVVMLSLKGAQGDTWEEMRASLALLVSMEFERHRYVAESAALSPSERGWFQRVADGTASVAELEGSLRLLTDLLARHHGQACMVIVDEYDAPITHARAHGFYDQAVQFMRGWLSNALKTNPSLAHGVLTGVQRISKESIFSGLNNIKVNTPLNTSSDERFGFTRAEVSALAAYTGHAEKTGELKAWYDGYRFGDADVYNPWSVLSYLSEGCVAQPYWTNTSGNSVLAEALASEDDDTVADLLDLLNPRATVDQWIDPNIAYGDIGRQTGALWSVLYMSGYLTTDDTAFPEDPSRLRPLRVPNAEVRGVFGREVADRARSVAGSTRRLRGLHTAITAGDATSLEHELGPILRDSASYYDLTSENACHMLLLGLLFGMPGYGDPLSNRESGYGRFDIRLEPSAAPAADGQVPLIVIEVKFLGTEASSERLAKAADEALGQIAQRAYDAGAPSSLRWGMAFAGKKMAAVCERQSSKGARRR